MAAGVVQHTNRTMMEIKTSTSIRSSELWRTLCFFRLGRWRAGVTSGVYDVIVDGAGDAALLGKEGTDS